MDSTVTKYWKLEASEMEAATAAEISRRQGIDKDLKEAAQLLKQGDTVAFPTETVYGLGADAGNSEAVQRIFTAKGRPSDNPLIVHIADVRQLEGLVDEAALTEEHRVLMKTFWPGPLTMVLPVHAGGVSPLVTAGLSTVGIRIPDHPVALALLREAGCPVAAPSANSSGRPSPTLASHVLEDLDGKIGGIVDGGPTGVGVESTVIQLVDGHLYILRPGGVTAEQLRTALPSVTLHEPKGEEIGSQETPRAPGMKYRHYAPKGRMQIVKGGTAEQAAAWIQHNVDAAKAEGASTGILTFEEHAALYRADLVIACGSLSRPETIAQELYAALRRFDEADIAYICAEACPETGIGLAIMNRLRKAAGDRIVHI